MQYTVVHCVLCCCTVICSDSAVEQQRGRGQRASVQHLSGRLEPRTRAPLPDARTRRLAQWYEHLCMYWFIPFVFNYHKFLSLKGTKLFEREFIEKYLLEQICDINYSPLVKTSRAGFIFIINPVCDTMQYCSSSLFSYEII